MQSPRDIRPTGAPQCRCGTPAPILLQSHTPRNPNRWFFKCDSCNYFKWADECPGYPSIQDSSKCTSAQQQQQLQQGQQRPYGQLQVQPGQQHNAQGQLPSPGSSGLPQYSEAAPAGPYRYASPVKQSPAFGAGWQQDQACIGMSPRGAVAQPTWQQQQQQPFQQASAPSWQHSLMPQQGQIYGPVQQARQQQPQPTPYHQQPLQSSMQQQQPWSRYGTPQQSWQQQQQYQDPPNAQQQQLPQPLQQCVGQRRQQRPQQQLQPGVYQGSLGLGSQKSLNAGPNSQQQQQSSHPNCQQSQQHMVAPQQQQWSSQQQQQPPKQYSSPVKPYQLPGQLQQRHYTSPVGQYGMAQQYASPLGQPQQQLQQPYMGQPLSPGTGPANSPTGLAPSAFSPGAGYSTPMKQQIPGTYGSGATLTPTVASLGAGITVQIVSPPAAYPNFIGFKTNYSEDFKACIKQLRYQETERQWVKYAKVWISLKSAQDQVVAHLRAAGFTVQEGSGAGATSTAALDLTSLEASKACLVLLVSQEDAERAAKAAVPDEVWGQLLPHQRQGVLAGLRRGGRVLLADEMGLGKTAQAIVLAACYPQDWPLLVIVPASLRGVWAAELEAWLPPALKPQHGHLQVIKNGNHLKTMLDTGLPSTAQQVLVITYDLVKKLPTTTAARFGVVICDESHAFKNKDTQRTQAVAAIVKGAQRALLLTGTPLLSRPIEAWSQVDMLRPNLLGSYEEYGQKYCVSNATMSPGPGGAGVRSGTGGRYFLGQQYQGCNGARLDELHKLLLANVMVRRTKAQVGVRLPDKTRMRVTVPLSSEFQPQLVSIRAAMHRLAAAGQTDTPAGKQLVNEYRMLTGQAKVAGVIEFVHSLPGVLSGDSDADEHHQQQHGKDGAGTSSASAVASNGQGKLLVFAYHHPVLDAIEDQLCNRHGLGFIRIDGRTSSISRQQEVMKFQMDSSVCVALLSIKAAGSGLTLTAADQVVFAEMHWNPTDLEQCEDRIHRLGQQRHCRIFYCMAPNSADDLMWSTNMRKLGIVGAAVDGTQGDSVADSMADMDTWRNVISRGDTHSAADGASRPLSPTAAGAATAAGHGVPPAADSSGQQQQQQSAVEEAPAAGQTDGSSSAADTGAADGGGVGPVVGGSNSRRHSLVEAFMAEHLRKAADVDAPRAITSNVAGPHAAAAATERDGNGFLGLRSAPAVSPGAADNHAEALQQVVSSHGSQGAGRQAAGSRAGAAVDTQGSQSTTGTTAAAGTEAAPGMATVGTGQWQQGQQQEEVCQVDMAHGVLEPGGSLGDEVSPAAAEQHDDMAMVEGTAGGQQLAKRQRQA